MHYYMYEIKNNVNGMIYVGIHKTKNLDDGYMGSGKILLQAFKKFGKDKFTKIILRTFTDEQTMRLAERELVNEEFLARKDVYNIVLGGGCGWQYVNKIYPNKPKSHDTRKKISESLLKNYPDQTRRAVSEAAKKPKSEDQKRKSSEALRGRKREPFSEETKRRMSESAKQRWSK